MEYALVATLGPASQREEVWQAMLAAGASGFRLNTSHLSLEQLRGWLQRLDAFFLARGEHTPVTLDLQGSKWRLGQFEAFELAQDALVRLVCVEVTQEAGVLPVPHQDFFAALAQSDCEIVLNDARSRLFVEQIDELEVIARVRLGGSISAHKGITLAESQYRIESLGEKDQRIVAQVEGLTWVRFAVSYVRDAEEMTRYRAGFPAEARLIAKLERREAMREAHGIASQADEVWLCRGDLGAELGLRGMAEAAHGFKTSLRTLPVLALLAGQVLEHLTEHATPTRAEVCGLHDALQAGYAGVVLSDETAIGVNPVEACRVAAMFREKTRG